MLNIVNIVSHRAYENSLKFTALGEKFVLFGGQELHKLLVTKTKQHTAVEVCFLSAANALMHF